MDERTASTARAPIRVAHLTSVHPRDDVRIFVKQCRSLARIGYDVTLVVADGKGTTVTDGVQIVDAGRRPGGRFGRVSVGAHKVIQAARKLAADIYHIHDPELLPWALLLRSQASRVVYDAHEHLPSTVLARHYLPRALLKPLSSVVGAIELAAAGRMSGIVAATPRILNRFESLKPASEGVYNFPIADELPRSTDWCRRERQACYVGGVSFNRGIREIARAAELCSTQLVVAGPLWDGLSPQIAASLPGWDRIRYVGKISRNQVADLLGSVRVGIVTLLPTRNHLDALPTKLFEYMSAGIPVVASNFPLWKEIVEATGTGLCVDPSDPKAIAEAIDTLVQDESFAATCGQNGIRAVAGEYNWAAQAVKLAGLYRRLI